MDNFCCLDGYHLYKKHSFAHCISFCWHQMICGDDAADEVVLVPCHSGEGHVCRGLAEAPVQPNGHMLQFCTLEFVHRACISKADWIIDNSATRGICIGVRVDCQSSACACHDPEAVRLCIESFYLCKHAVHEVVCFVPVLGQLHSEPCVHGNLAWQRHPIRSQLPVVIVVVRHVGVVARDQAACPLVPVAKQNFDGQVVDYAGAATGASRKSGVAIGAMQHGFHVQCIWLLMPAPSFVPVAEAVDKSFPFCPHRLVVSQEVQLAL